MPSQPEPAAVAVASWTIKHIQHKIWPLKKCSDTKWVELDSRDYVDVGRLGGIKPKISYV